MLLGVACAARRLIRTAARLGRVHLDGVEKLAGQRNHV
jgi:hypothetical protein